MNSFNCIIAKDLNHISQVLDSSFYRIISGGTSILRENNPFIGSFGKPYDGFIDISGCRDLNYMYLDGTVIKIGSATTFSTILGSTVTKTHLPILIDTCKNIGTIQTRNRGTIGGHIVSEFNGDALTALYALDAMVKIRTSAGMTRTSAIAELSLNANEFIMELSVPLQSGDGKFIKFPFSTHDRIAVVGIKKTKRIFIGGIDKKPCSVQEDTLLENIQEPYRKHIAKELVKEMKTAW